MTEHTTHPAGTFSWIDLISPDVARSSEFYGALFGWEAVEQGSEAGGYTMLTLHGRTVGALSPQQSPDQPPGWNVYVATSDADATTAAVESAGGTVVLPPMDVLTAGRLAVYLDPTGAKINVWQPGDHPGAQLTDEAGTWAWSELLSRDVEASAAFYRSVFGWGLRRDSHYNEWQHEGRIIGGLMAMPDMVPAGVLSYWLPYVAVDDVAGTAARASDLGGGVRVPSQDFGGGEFAVIDDPHGASLGLLRLASAG